MGAYIRPGFFMTHVVNPVMGRWRRVPALIVRGRRSGRLLTVPMGEPLELEGRRYLVSGRGETHWVRNLRCAGHAAFRRRGTSTSFRAVELHGVEQERVVGAYRAKLGHAVDSYFERIPEAGGHPVFRMDPTREPLPEGTRGDRP